MTGERRLLLNETLRAHILECSALSDDECDLSELGREQETIRVAEGVALRTDVDVAEQGERLDVTLLVHRVVGHVHVTLANSLTLDTTEVDGLLLRVVLHDLDDGEAVDCRQVGVGSLPDRTCRRRVVVQLHTHARLLRTLASEDVDSGGLRDLCSTNEDLLALGIGRLDADHKVAVAHPNVLDLDIQFVAGENHSDERNIVPRRKKAQRNSQHDYINETYATTRPGLP